MGKIIMGNEQRSYIRNTQNGEGDTLLHIAVTKEDLPVIQDIFAFSSTTHANAQGKKPLDLAIEQLHPKIIDCRNNNQVAILETLANSIANRAYLESDKTECLQKLIALELACKNNPSPSFTFIPNATLLHNLIPKKHHMNSEQFLANIYKEAIDNETGNTFTHVCVNQEDPDELFKLVCNDRISDVTNKSNLNAFEVAFCNFSAFITKTELIDAKNAVFNRVRCCYFILYYYYTKNSTDSCCEKHKRPSK
jgi:ankyrin repeat protein